MKFYQIKPEYINIKDIKEYIDAFETDMLPSIAMKEQYYLGNNPYITRRSNGTNDSGAPDWRLRVSYARKIINTVAGYMYKPGNTKYNYNNDKYRTRIEEIFNNNKEIIKTSQIGKIVSTQGFGYELFLADGDGNPIWVIADPKEIIPFYTNELNGRLYCFIRYTTIKEGGDYVKYIDVYYPDVIKHYKIYKNQIKENRADTNNIYFASKMPPLNIIKNNEEMQGDFESVVSDGNNAGLIDAYDVMYSDGMNEEDRFAWAYMLISEAMNKEDADKIKEKRIIQNLGSEGFVKFLTKEIPTDFFKMMLESIKREIHQQTHVPDFLDTNINAQISGIAIEKLLYDFEFICTAKETYFKDGLLNRIRLIDALENITDAKFIKEDIEIIMERNKPIDRLANADIATKYKQSGLPITDKTLMENFAPFVKDVDKEIEEFNEQEEENMNNMIDNEIFNFGGIDGQGNNDSEISEQVQV